MKVIFVETRYKRKVNLPKKVIDKLPKRIGLCTTINFYHSLPNLKKKIESTGREVVLIKGLHTKHKGQIYGCNLERFDLESFLFIGDGLFHPKALLLGNNKDVHVWNPIQREYKLLTPKLVEDEIRRQNAGLSAFLNSRRIGVILSTKPGQSYLKLALGLRKRFPDKEFYFIVMDTISFEALEDFNFIEVWINTACPRIGWDDTKRTRKPMIDFTTLNSLPTLQDSGSNS